MHTAEAIVKNMLPNVLTFKAESQWCTTTVEKWLKSRATTPNGRATYTMPHATYHVQHATYHMQHATYHVQHATYHVQHATYHVQHAACHRTTCSMRACGRTAEHS